jgi:hypothetical protein
MNEKQNRSSRSGDSEEPTDDPKTRIGGGGPEKPENHDQANEASPFEGSASLRVDMGILATDLAFPVFPQAHGHERDPEDVHHIERPDGDGSARRLAAEAVVIAKCNSLWPEMVGAVDKKHVIPRPRSGRSSIHDRSCDSVR